LAAGSAASGALAYLVFALTTRALGAELAAPVSVLWSYWSLAGAALTFPLQHWVASTVVLHGEGAVRAVLPRLFLGLVAASLALGAVTWLGRDALFHRDGLAFPGLVALVTVGSAVIGLARGGLTAHDRFLGLAVNLVGENALRCLVVAALASADVRSPTAYGLGLVVGHLVAFVQPSALAFARDPGRGATRSAFAFLSTSGTAQLLSQVVLTGGPVLLAIAGGTAAEVTAMFAVLALFRAPYILALGAVSQLTGVMTRLVARGDAAAIRRVRALIVGGTIGLAVPTGVIGLLLGPTLLRLIFGADLAFGEAESAMVAVACTFAVGNLVCTVTVMARNRPSALVWAWTAAIAGAAAGFGVLAALPATSRIASAFLVAELLAFALLLLVPLRDRERSGRARWRRA
jgi:hypothetical protein